MIVLHRSPKIVFLLASTCFALLSGVARADLIAQENSNYQIVLPADAIPAERTAAAELKDYLQHISGAELPVVDEAQYDGRHPMVAVGFNNKLPAALQAVHFGPLGAEEILIGSENGTVLLAGGRPRGSLYAVYEYLHRLGVRWYTPEATTIPALKNIPLPTGIYRYKPPMVSRSQLVGNNPTDEWSARNRLNSIRLWASLPDKYGGGLGQGPDMHTFSRIVSVPVLKAHTNWMAMVNGEREQPVGSSWGLCLSDPELRRFLVDRTLDWARKNPDRKGVWIGQNDGSHFCTCEKCTAFYNAHGGKPSSLVVLVLNELAEALQKEMPDRTAKTLAYSWSMQAPDNMRVADNAIIMFSAPGTFAKPIEGDPDRAKLRDAIQGWRGITKNLEVYLYSAPWENYWFVEPSTYAGAQNIQWAYRNGVTNVYTHVSGFGNTFGSDAVYLRGWLYARLSWDPTADPNALVEDFVRGYYGPAADAVLKATAMIHRDLFDARGNLRQHNTSDIVPNHVDPKVMRAVNLMYEKTYASLQDPVYKKRLSLEWIPYLWTDTWLGFSSPGKYNPATKTWSVPMQDGELRNRYGKLVKQFMIDDKIDVLKERRGFNPNKLALDKMGIPWSATQLKNAHSEVVVVPGVAGKITNFRDARSDFNPLKPYWGFAITEYPLYGSSRETINKDLVASYTATPGPDQSVTLTGNAGGARITKTVSLRDDSLNLDLTALPTKTGPVEMSSSFMLDLQDKAFGDHPTVYIEKRDGTWTTRVMGMETTFWYIAGSLDLTGATGRIVIAAEKRREGLLLTLDPAQTTRLDFEYDTYAKWPADQGRMMWLSPLVLKPAAAGQSVQLALSLEILPDAKALVAPAG